MRLSDESMIEWLQVTLVKSLKRLSAATWIWIECHQSILSSGPKVTHHVV